MGLNWKPVCTFILVCCNAHTRTWAVLTSRTAQCPRVSFTLAATNCITTGLLTFTIVLWATTSLEIVSFHRWNTCVCVYACAYACNQLWTPCEERHLLGKKFIFPFWVLLQFLNSGKMSKDSAQQDHLSSLDIFWFFSDLLMFFSLWSIFLAVKKTELSKHEHKQSLSRFVLTSS